MRLHTIRAVIAILALLFSVPALAEDQQINADRPGVGIDADVIPLKTFQVEIGTDGYEFRMSIANNLEVAKDNTSFGAKYAIVYNNKFDLSAKLGYDKNNGAFIEVPSKYIINKYFYFGTDVQIAKHSQTYVTEYNFTPTDTLTVESSIYYDTKIKTGIYVSWIPPKKHNLQFDVGYSQHKITFGVSSAFKFVQ